MAGHIRAEALPRRSPPRAADDNFDTALELGFASSIRREWAWRVKRGESLANLNAFARLADPEAG